MKNPAIAANPAPAILISESEEGDCSGRIEVSKGELEDLSGLTAVGFDLLNGQASAGTEPSKTPLKIVAERAIVKDTRNRFMVLYTVTTLLIIS